MNAFLLAIETSCDETAIAILRGRERLASEVASQVAAHQPYGGVVPEVASRHHLRHAPRLLEQAVSHSGISLGEIDAFAATSGPGLASSLMIGASLAKGLALGFAKPYLAINHLEGHLLSPFFGGASLRRAAEGALETGGIYSSARKSLALPKKDESEIVPNVSLLVSGGHTLLVEVDRLGAYRIVGRTVDDAAGEAFDKVAKMLGLAYPGGPEIERCAVGGDSARFDLPRSMLHSGDANFSFSGLKTAVRYLLARLPLIPSERVEPNDGANELAKSASVVASRDENVLCDLCAAFQCAVVEVLVAKTITAARAAQRKLVTVSGGVSCNGELRRQMSAGCERAGLEVRFAAPQLSTDNAAMIAFAAALRFERGESTPLTSEIDPNFALT